MVKRINLRIILLVFAVFLLILFTVRILLPRQMDDIRLNRLCEDEFLEKSNILMVIPLFDNVSIAGNRTWCEEIANLNKTLGMHGVYHTPKEFSIFRDESYVRFGMEEFKNCFGYYPKFFRAPEFLISSENAKLVNSLNMTILGANNLLFHKIYHCTDFEKTSWLVWQNNFNKIF